MLKHSLLLIYRNFRRYKGTFFINLIGLASGLTCTLLIYLWVHDELHVDKFHEKNSRLYRVMGHERRPGVIETNPYTPGPLAEALAREMPEVQYAVAATPSFWKWNFRLSAQGKHTKGVGQAVGKDFFNTFSYHLLEGRPDRVLADKNSVVLSAALARNLFGTTENAVGKTVEWQEQQLKRTCRVTGVFSSVPANSSEQFDFLFSFEVMKEISPPVSEWGAGGSFSTCVVLKEGTDVDRFNAKVAGFMKNKLPDSGVTLFLKPFSAQYLYGAYENGQQTGGRIAYVRLFSVIAGFILLIACINFMNLSTARASRRSKEVGVKKVIGAGRETLLLQYLGESLLTAFLSLLLAILLVALLLPEFNQITGKALSLHLEEDVILAFLGITLLTGLLAGSYPALYLSGFKPAVVLKGRFSSTAGELWTRQGLVVFQFALSVVFIVSVLVVYQQIELVQTKNLGYEKDNVIYFDREGKVESDPEAFLSALRNVPGVQSASSIFRIEHIAGTFMPVTGLGWEGRNADNAVKFAQIMGSYQLIETLDMGMKEGRSFSRDFGADSTGIIFNEAAIKVMGLKDPVGKTVRLWDQDMQIIGVAKDFHFESLYEEVKPLFFRLVPRETDQIVVKLEAGHEKASLERLRAFYKAYNPGFVLDYTFLDQDYQALYASEKRVSVLSQYFAGLAVLISCLGLLGLAVFSAEKRRKEIGVRKVFGAGEGSIVYLLSGEFTKLVLVSVLIALPASYLLASAWLAGFAYRIELEPWFFVLAGGLALLTAFLTVGMQALKAARVNPVYCLKEE